MPIKSEKQRRLVECAAHTEGGCGGMTQEAARKFLEHGDESVLPAFMRDGAIDISGVKGHAAGVIHIAPDGDILLVHRAKGEKNFGGHWALPGGNVEEGEEPGFGARREVVEELGTDAPDGHRHLLGQVITPNGLAFHTFVQPVTDKFAPKLNGEHSGYTWAPPHALPQPVHPAVAKVIEDRIGVTGDMSPEDWAGLRDGFLKWIAEEEVEGEHKGDARFVTEDDLRARFGFDYANQEIKLSRMAVDAIPLALDRESVRAKDSQGRMHISRTPICKACVSPYLGSEIPNWEELGLDKNKTYHLLRDPEELQRAIPTFNNLPLLRKHLPTSADDHPQMETVGNIGSNAQWEEPYVTNSMAIWVGDDIDGIESRKKRELSPGYEYRADMTPGIFRGNRYDGVMRDIVGNHVAIVEVGRQGPDVIVGDSAEELMDKKMQAAIARTQTIGALVTYLRPRLAMDAKIEIAPLFKDVTGKKFGFDRNIIIKPLEALLKDKLAKDADVSGLRNLIDACGKGEESHDEIIDPSAQAAIEASAGALPITVPPPATDNHAPIREFLKSKGMGDDDIGRVCDMLPANALGNDEDDDDDDKDKDKDRADDERDDDEDDKDKDDKDPKGKDRKMGKDRVTKSAMDEAIKTATEATADLVRKQVREEARGAQIALAKVRPIVGELSPTLALDSAPAVYRHVLKMKGVPNAETIHESALEGMIALLPKSTATTPSKPFAMDAESVKSTTERFPGLANLRPSL